MIIQHRDSLEESEDMESLMDNEIVEEEEEESDEQGTNPVLGENLQNDIGRGVLHHRKSSLALTPEEEPFDINPYIRDSALLIDRMSICEHCGSSLIGNGAVVASSSAAREGVDDGGGWLCFRSGCFGRKKGQEDDDGVVLTTTSMREGRYLRRTIQFDFDVNTVASKRRQSTISSSILKAKRGPNDVKYGLILPALKHQLKLLLVFTHPDPVCETFSKAAEKLGFEVTVCQTDIGVLDEYQAKSHDLVIVDARISKTFDNDLLCR
ncbi:hypothetical protein GWI33_004187 [Rhynchophorus ferrugineus]|uniref:PDE8-like REC N-terminal domain-containing protein n=1 Tax=Rhynchophorus ferrugineus TaxID=354439 RepID=A0A834IT10_RHYFE|nr:hypothetical protein GWI33_004187 [Rhynchophorus ferrugineus]